ncbi:YolD-like family protein [Viridibacillus sp. NPDC096237]|uniref:YolD-like family protein n=1 Tax=Viridibacillus sp. NPDC096237 TaxID=3390721 RepID=UPI003D007F18
MKRPKLDEWQLEDFQLTISQALNENKPVQITTWANGEIVIAEGLLQEVDKYHNECLLKCQLDVIKRIQLSSICDICLLEEV